MSLLHQNRVLKLNANWKVIGVTTLQKAFIAMSRPGTNKKPRYSSLDIEYPVLEDGSVDFKSPCLVNPLRWEDWIKLPVRPYDNYINTCNMQVRVPTVIIANNYKHVPVKYPRYSKHAVWSRDDSKCQITGERVTKATGNIDHWNPTSRGGKTSFENCAILNKRLNNLKGDLTMEEFCKKHNFKLPKRPSRPEPKFARIKNVFGIRDWDLFLEP